MRPPPTLRAVYLTDPPEAAVPTIPTSSPPPEAEPGARSLFGSGRVPLQLLAAVGERLAASVSGMQQQAQSGEAVAQPPANTSEAAGELARLEQLGLQLQELVQVVARAGQLRHESVDLGLALLQTVAEWSTEADRQGVELHGPARSVLVHANPAALKHLLDLLVEHALQQGRVVRLDIEAPADGPFVYVAANVSAEPASSSPVRDTLAWMLLQWLARALGLSPQRQAVPAGERLMLALPRG